MSRDWTSDLVSFQQAVCAGSDIGPSVLRRIPGETIRLRCKLMLEELTEVFDAFGVRLPALDTARRQLEAYALGSLAEVEPSHLAKELADLAYVTVGTAVAAGYDLEPCWDAVHASNMAKAGGEVRPDGKRLKPAGWKPPDMKAALARGRKLG